MRSARFALPVLLAALTPFTAAAQSAPEPPRTPVEGSSAPAASTAVPADGSGTIEPYGLQDVAEHGLRSTETLFNGASLAGAGTNPNPIILRDAKKVNGYFGRVGDGLTLIDVGLTGFSMGTDIERGNYAAAARTGVAAVIEQCIDRGIQYVCGTAAASTTGPGAVFTAPLCVAAVTTVKEICDSKLKEYTGKSMSQHIVDGGEAALTSASSAFQSFRDKAQRDFGSAQRVADAKHAAMSNANQAVRAEQAAQQQAAYDAAQQSATSANDAIFFNGLMQGLGSSFAPAQPIPLAPVAAPSGCHSGHDETAHPGGCHTPRGGTAN